MTLSEATATLTAIDVQNITPLDDLPNDVGGLSASELKAKFDKAGVDLKAFLLDLIVALIDSIDDAAKGITFQGVSGSSIQDGTITAEKLMAIEGAEAVITSNIRDNNVTEAKLSTEFQTKVNNAISSISANGTRISGNAASITTLQTAVNALSSGKQAKHKTLSVTLSAGATSWTVSASGVTAENTVIVAPAYASADEAASKRVLCSAQRNNSLTFTAKRSTASAVTMNVLILDV